MKYFKVNLESNQVRTNSKRTDFLISNELYTTHEITKMKLDNSFILKHFTPIELSKKKTYFNFGARFECKLI